MAKKRLYLDSARGYDRVSSVYDEKTEYLNSFEKGQVLPMLGAVKGKKILDAGAGTGRLTLQLLRRGAEVAALDVSGVMLQALKRKAERIFKIRSDAILRLVCVTGDAEELPFPNDTFDLVVATFLLVHLKDPARFLSEAYRVLKAGGRLLVTNINQKKPPEIETPDGAVAIESHYHRPERVREFLRDQAFEIENEEIVRESGVWINQILLCRK